MNIVHKLASGIRDTVERTYDQIWNIFESLASVGLAQARPNNQLLLVTAAPVQRLLMPSNVAGIMRMIGGIWFLLA